MAGTIRKGGEWMVAFSQVRTPIFTVVMRRSFGVAGNNYATPRSQPSMRVAWPAADVGGIPPEGGIEAAYKRQLAEAEDPVALRAELEARIESVRGPLGPPLEVPNRRDDRPPRHPSLHLRLGGPRLPNRQPNQAIWHPDPCNSVPDRGEGSVPRGPSRGEKAGCTFGPWFFAFGARSVDGPSLRGTCGTAPSGRHVAVDSASRHACFSS